LTSEPNSASLTRIVILFSLTNAKPPVTTKVTQLEDEASRTKIKPVSKPVKTGI
jgi:hypothetical protein